MNATEDILTEEQITDNFKWNLRDVQLVANEMREEQKKLGVDLEKIVKERLFKERKEPIEIARIIEMPLCDIISIKKET